MAITLDDLERSGLPKESSPEEVAFCEAILTVTAGLSRRPEPVVIIVREK